MNIKQKHKKTKCPKCGSGEIHTLGLDQMCLDCDWDNTFLLVKLGQMDHLTKAFDQQFVSKQTFDDLDVKSNDDRSLRKCAPIAPAYQAQRPIADCGSEEAAS